jgi:Uma2 family endonuclease
MGANEQPLLLQRHRLTVDEYYRMAEVGLLAPDARTELIDGEIIDMAPQKLRHAWVVNELTARLHEVIGRKAHITCQTPLRLSDRNEPEPDLMLLKAPAQRYLQVAAGAADVLLVVEVADGTARYDREIKLPLYARHGVGVVWIFDLDSGLLRVHSCPQADAYLDTRETASPGVELLPGLAGLRVDLAGLLP